MSNAIAYFAAQSVAREKKFYNVDFWSSKAAEKQCQEYQEVNNNLLISLALYLHPPFSLFFHIPKLF